MQDFSNNISSKSGKIGYSERKVCFLSHLKSLIFWFVDFFNPLDLIMMHWFSRLLQAQSLSILMVFNLISQLKAPVQIR